MTTCLFLWSLFHGKHKWEALRCFKHEPRCHRYWKAKGYMWTQRGKKAINRHICCCILTVVVWMHLLVHVVPNLLLRGSWRCVLRKDSYAEAHNWKQCPTVLTATSSQCPNQGRLRVVFVSPLSLSPWPHCNISHLYLFLLSPCKVPAAKERPLGELDLVVPAHQRSLLLKTQVPT